MGEAAFNGMARSYVGCNPSSQPNVRWYARHLPDFLSSVSPYAGMPELAELALLERSLNDAGDAADAPAVTFAGLAALAPEQVGAAILDIHPSVRRFRVRTNATGLWSCLKCGEIPPKPSRLVAPQEILVWRHDGTSRFRLLGGEEAFAFDAAAEGIRSAVSSKRSRPGRSRHRASARRRLPARLDRSPGRFAHPVCRFRRIEIIEIDPLIW
jgi:hypothetical protein